MVAHFIDRQLANLPAVVRPGWFSITGRVDVETVCAALCEHVLADAHERVLLPEGVIAAFQEEFVGDERLGVLPDFFGCVGDESRFRSLRDVWFIVGLKDIIRGRNSRFARQIDGFGRYVTADVPKAGAELLMPHFPEPRLG